jgi:fatty-acyl-CoA synthase
MQTLLERFWSRVLEFPDQDFCEFVTITGRQSVTWSEIGHLSNEFQRQIEQLNVPHGTAVLIFLPHCVPMYGAFIGAMTAGLVPSFMPPPNEKQDPTLYWSSHHALLQRLGEPVVVTGNSTLALMRDAGLPLKHVLTVETLAAKDGSSGTPKHHPDPDEIALLQHSSGTTGLKKGVALTYRQIDNQLSAYSTALRITQEDVVVSWLPLYHDMGLIACFLLPIYCGIKFVHMDAFHWLSRPLLLLDLIGQSRGTLCWLPNFAFEHLTNVSSPTALKGIRLHTLRALINCSEPCRAVTFTRFQDKFLAAGLREDALQCCYAMAETVFAVSQTESGHHFNVRHFARASLDVGARAVPVAADAEDGLPLLSSGTPIEGVEVEVRDANGSVVPAGTVGQLVVKGNFVFTGYYKNHELTQARLKDGWYHTQDVGFIVDDQIFVLGRLDDVIICNGKNIYAHEVESSVASVPGVKPGRCVAVPVDDPRSGSQRLVIVAEYETDDALVLSQAREVIRARVFAAAGIPPNAIRFVPPGWLVKTTSGKISRKENAAKYKRSHGN